MNLLGRYTVHIGDLGTRAYGPGDYCYLLDHDHVYLFQVTNIGEYVLRAESGLHIGRKYSGTAQRLWEEGGAFQRTGEIEPADNVPQRKLKPYTHASLQAILSERQSKQGKLRAKQSGIAALLRRRSPRDNLTDLEKR
jgi:hypothetical protein